MYTHLIRLMFRDDDYLVSLNHGDQEPIGRIEITTNDTNPWSTPDTYGAWVMYDHEADAFAPIGTFPDILSAANAVYGVHMMLTQ